MYKSLARGNWHPARARHHGTVRTTIAHDPASAFCRARRPRSALASGVERIDEQIRSGAIPDASAWLASRPRQLLSYPTTRTGSISGRPADLLDASHAQLLRRLQRLSTATAAAATIGHITPRHASLHTRRSVSSRDTWTLHPSFRRTSLPSRRQRAPPTREPATAAQRCEHAFAAQPSIASQ